MPRGQYDRTALKTSKTDNTKTADTTVAKRRGRKPGSKNTAKFVAPPPSTAQADAMEHLYQVRANLSVLSTLATHFSDLSSLREEVAANIEILTSLRKQLFGSTETIITDKASEMSSYAADTVAHVPTEMTHS